jgi:uncharacterized protein (TIGR01244 family)
VDSQTRANVPSYAHDAPTTRPRVTLADLARQLPNGSCPLPGIAGAGQLDAAQVREAAAAGVRTVIDLRPTFEPHGFDEAAEVRAAGMEYVNIPVTPDTLDDATFDRFLEVMRDAKRRPVLVKCATANRVGGMLLAYLLLDEKMPEREALQLAQQVGLRGTNYAALGVDYARRHAAKG